MKLANNVQIKLLYASTDIVIPIDNKDRPEAIEFWKNLKAGTGKEVEITIKVID